MGNRSITQDEADDKVSKRKEQAEVSAFEKLLQEQQGWIDDWVNIPGMKARRDTKLKEKEETKKNLDSCKKSVTDKESERAHKRQETLNVVKKHQAFL